MKVRVQWKGEEKRFDLALSQNAESSGLEGKGKEEVKKLLEEVKRSFGVRPLDSHGARSGRSELKLTDGDVAVDSDKVLAQLCFNATRRRANAKESLLLFAYENKKDTATERINFVPHPRTITAAGDLEYFTSKRGKQTVSYALAELVDNALSATQHLTTNRKIRIVFSVNSSSQRDGCIFIEDNGTGMNKAQLNDWAVMNLSKSERDLEGAAPGPVSSESDTRNSISVSGLESQHHLCTGTQQTQKQKQAGWKQDRFLFSSLSFFGVGSKNAAFFLGNSVHMATKQEGNIFVHDLLLNANELERKYRNRENAYEADLIHRNPGDVSTLSSAETRFEQAVQAVVEETAECRGGNEASFTRLTISELKEEIADQIKDKYSCEQICRELAHIYHFYIHGSKGTYGGEADLRNCTKLPDGSALPEIQVESYCEGRLIFKKNLYDVDDDSVSSHLKSQKDEFLFSLEVPERGCVDGILYYFPFDSEKETMPMSQGSPSPEATQTTQFDLTQVSLTQFTNHQSQMSLDQSLATIPTERRCLFEAFWQGRLIPESRVSSLPFIDAIFQRQGTYMKDKIPPEVVNRIWGCLFFGPEFRVTRNKLSFRDNLEDLLCSSFSSNRNTERMFKDWLARCHNELDQTLSFEKMCSVEVQAKMRNRFGENRTYFDKVVMGDVELSTGDVVQLKTAPKVVGEISSVLATKVMHQDGRHSSGLLAIRQIPEEIYGKENLVLYPLRRFKSKLSEEEVKAHTKKQWKKAPCSISIEPLLFATGKIHDFKAGDNFPPTYITVSNATGQKITKGVIGGNKHNLSVVQKLYYIGSDLPQELPDLSLAVKESLNQDSHSNPIELLCVSNCTPRSDVFGFQKVNGGFKKSGYYLMKFNVEPKTSKSQLMLEMKCFVKPGEAERVDWEWESEVGDVRLGEELPPLSLSLFDEFDNLAKTSLYADKVSLLVETSSYEIKAECKICANKGKINLTNIRLVQGDNQNIPFFSERGRNHLHAKPTPLKGKLNLKVGKLVGSIPKVTIFPGLPTSFDVLSGIDISVNSESNPLLMNQDSQLPSFVIALKDQFGNRTFPPKDFTYSLNVKCDGLFPESKLLTVEDNGILRVEGFTAETPLCTRAVLQLQCSPLGSILETCTNNSESIFERIVWLQIEPSSKPANLTVFRGAAEVLKDADGSDDYIIEDVEVAAFLEDLSVQIRDACGRPATCGEAAKLTCSWVKGTKEVQIDANSQIKLPSLTVQDNCGSIVSFWIRIIVDSVQLESSIYVKASPGPPYSWALSCESNKVRSGVPFTVTIEAVDKYQNRCKSSSSQLPKPVIIPQSERELQFKSEDWEAHWNCDEDNMYTYSAKIVLLGEEGPIALQVRSENDNKMTEDIWHVPLLPGPPAKLKLNIANQNQTFYTQCFLESIAVTVHDSWGNFVTCSDFEIVLQPSAISCDVEGLSGNISSKKGNRKKVVDGKAEFSTVKICCPKAGKYSLQANCGSRKLSIEEANLEINVQSCNRVCKLSTVLPEQKCQAGGSIDIDVIFETEDGKAVPRELVLGNVDVIITPKGKATEESVSAKFVDYDEDKLAVQFASEKVTSAGIYNITATYEEGRPELACVMPSTEVKVRSLSTTFEVTPFQPKQLCLIPMEIESECTLLQISDKTVSSKPILESATMQVQDCYGNFVAKQGVKVSIHLYEDEGLQREMKNVLTCDGSLVSDKAGRVKVGNVHLDKSALSGKKDATHDMHFVVYCNFRKQKLVGWRRILSYSNDELHTSMMEKYTKRKLEIEKQISAVKQTLQKEQEVQLVQKEKLKNLEEARTSKLKAIGERSNQNFDDLLEQQQRKLKEAESEGKRKPLMKQLQKFKNSYALVKKVSSDLCLGWMVEQATVEHENLARILSWFRRSKLQVLIMTNMEGMNRARKALKQKKLEIPDMIAEEAMRVYDPSRIRRKVSCKVSSAEAALHGQLGLLPKKLHEESLLGSDEALTFGLPHHYIDKQRWLKGMTAWPKGFVGHATNLLRPSKHKNKDGNQRRTILYTLAGSALVFDKWENGYAYFVNCRKMKVDVPTMFNMDGTCVESDGVLSGSRNQAPPMEAMKICMGASSESKAFMEAKKKEEILRSIIMLKASIDEARSKLKQQDESKKVHSRKLKELKASLQEVTHGLEGLSARRGSQIAMQALQELDPNRSQDEVQEEEVPSSERKRASPPRAQERSSRRRRLIYEMEDE